MPTLYQQRAVESILRFTPLAYHLKILSPSERTWQHTAAESETGRTRTRTGPGRDLLQVLVLFLGHQLPSADESDQV